MKDVSKVLKKNRKTINRRIIFINHNINKIINNYEDYLNRLHLSFESSELIEELKSDIDEFNLKEVYLVYNKRPVYFIDYILILDKECMTDEEWDDYNETLKEPHIKVSVDKALDLLETQNKIIR